MKLLVYFVAYYWDNYQGGSGKYVESKLLVEIDDDTSASFIWEKVHDKIKAHLKLSRPYDQSAYSKTQGEYSIIKAELL